MVRMFGRSAQNSGRRSERGSNGSPKSQSGRNSRGGASKGGASKGGSYGAAAKKERVALKSYGRNERVAAALLREAAHILANDIKDPRVNLASVTEVKVTPDLRQATIYISFMHDNEEKIKESMAALNSAAGFMRSTCASRLDMRYVPQINFEYDPLIKEGMRLDALIASGLNSNNPADFDPEAEADAQAAARAAARAAAAAATDEDADSDEDADATVDADADDEADNRTDPARADD